LLTLLLCLLVAAPVAAQQPVGPVLSLGFNEDKGPVCVDAAGSAVGRIQQAEFGPLRIEGAVGGGLWFSETPGQCVTVPDRPELDLRTELTLTAWIWPRRLGGFQTILWKGDRRGAIDLVNYRLALRPEGQLEFAFKGPADEWYQLSTKTPVAVGTWSHVAATYNRGTVRLLVNGQCVTEGRLGIYAGGDVKTPAWHGDQMLTNDAPVEVGQGQELDGEPGQGFCGAIDEVCLWATALPSLPETPTPPQRSPLSSLLLVEKEYSAAELQATPYLTGRVEGARAPWFLDIEFSGDKDRSVRLPGETAPDGSFRYLLNQFGGPMDLRGASGLRVRVYRCNTADKLALQDMALDAGRAAAKIVVQPEKRLQRIRGFGCYADVPNTMVPDSAEREAQYGPLLAEMKEVGISQLDFAVFPQSVEPENDDADPQHLNWDAVRKNFQADKRAQTLVAYLRYLESKGFAVGLRFQGFAPWQWVKQPAGKPIPNSDEVAESAVAILTLVREAGVRPTHFVPIWEPPYAPEVVAEICAKTARLAKKHGIEIPIVGPYRIATGGQGMNPDTMPDRYATGQRFVEPYMNIAGDVCDVIGVEDYASGCAMIEPNLKRLWREVIDPLNKSGRPKELWMLEYGAPCGVGPWNFVVSRWHGPYANYESAFRLAVCLHQEFNGGVNNFLFWKAYDQVGDGNLISCWGLVKSSLHDYERRPPYYIARMFWKHIPCGAQHLACTSEAGILANAFGKDQRFTVVLTNPRPTDVRADLRLAGVELAPQADLYTSTEEIKYQQREIAARGDRLSSITLPPRSVSTLVCRAAHVGQPFDQTNWGEARDGRVYLSDLAWAAVSQAGKKGLLREQIQGQGVNVARDATLLNDWITLNRTRYRKGLGMKAPAEVVYELDGNYAAFEAVVGIDDAATKPNTAGVIFEVFVDGKKAFSSGPIQAGQKPKPVAVSCKGAKELKLLATPVGSHSPNTLADWAEARLTVESKQLP
jgi:hypothetical protein